MGTTTTTKKQIVDLLATSEAPLTTREIADKLGISLNSVQYHVKRLRDLGELPDGKLAIREQKTIKDLDAKIVKVLKGASSTMTIREIAEALGLNDKSGRHLIQVHVNKLKEQDALPAGKLLMRQEKSKQEQQAIKGEIFRLVEKHHPISIRTIFYMLVSEEIIPKTEAAATLIQGYVREMRRDGDLDYEWIVDESRTAWMPGGHKDESEFIESVLEDVDFDPWHGLPRRVEIWVESRSILGMIDGASRWKMRVPIYPCNGHPSDSYLREAAQVIKEDGRPLTIIYCGDLDPGGQLIESDVVEKLRHGGAEGRKGAAEFLGKDWDIEFRRVAITQEQIDEYGIPTRPRKKSDKRLKDRTGRALTDKAVECEALEALQPGVLVKCIEEAVEEYMPSGHRYEVMLRELETEKKIRNALDAQENPCAEEKNRIEALEVIAEKYKGLLEKLWRYMALNPGATEAGALNVLDERYEINSHLWMLTRKKDEKQDLF